MSAAVAKSSPAKKTSPKKKATAAPAAKKAAAPTHPAYAAMVRAAIKGLKEPKGASRAAIVKYVFANYKVGSDFNRVNSRVKMALKRGLEKGSLKHAKESTVGASGRFRLGDKPATAAPKAKKPRAPKAAVKKTTATKKATSPKKPKKATTPKKPKASPKKPKVAKKPKSPAKKAAKSPKAKKPAAKKVTKKAAPKKA